MKLYEITIRNEQTGEVATLSVRSYCPQDAQVEALSQVFRRHGWRSATAMSVEDGPSVFAQVTAAQPHSG